MNRSRISQLREFLDENPSIPLAVIDNALTIHAIACNKVLPLQVMKMGRVQIQKGRRVRSSSYEVAKGLRWV